jgi:hypothetical protein
LLVVPGLQGFGATGVGMALSSIVHLMALSNRLLRPAVGV